MAPNLLSALGGVTTVFQLFQKSEGNLIENSKGLKMHRHGAPIHLKSSVMQQSQCTFNFN